MRDFPLLSRLFVNEAHTLTDITRGAAPESHPVQKDWLISSSFSSLSNGMKFIENKFTGRRKKEANDGVVFYFGLEMSDVLDITLFLC